MLSVPSLLKTGMLDPDSAANILLKRSDEVVFLAVGEQSAADALSLGPAVSADAARPVSA